MEFDSFRFGERRRGGVCFYNLRAMFSCQMRWTPNLPISHPFFTIYPGSATVQGLLSQRQSWGTRYRRLGRPISSKVSTSWCVFIFCSKFIFCTSWPFNVAATPWKMPLLGCLSCTVLKRRKKPMRKIQSERYEHIWRRRNKEERQRKNLEIKVVTREHEKLCYQTPFDWPGT